MGLKLSYIAILETPTEKVTFDLSSAATHGPEVKVLNRSMDLWGWMKEKGMDSKMGLEDVVELARYMIDVKDKDVAANV
jgi:hypothetical protein